MKLVATLKENGKCMDTEEEILSVKTGFIIQKLAWIDWCQAIRWNYNADKDAAEKFASRFQGLIKAGDDDDS